MTTVTLHSATPLSDSALFLSFSARLSERQRAALSALAAGRPILAAAASAGVHRATLHGWLSHCEDFQAAYAALCRHQSEADSDLAAIARASLQALITDPATPASSASAPSRPPSSSSSPVPSDTLIPRRSSTWLL